jgi:hypothetical protein
MSKDEENARKTVLLAVVVVCRLGDSEYFKSTYRDSPRHPQSSLANSYSILT